MRSGSRGISCGFDLIRAVSRGQQRESATFMSLHQMHLTIALRASGHIEGEWVLPDFPGQRRAFTAAVIPLEQIRKTCDPCFIRCESAGRPSQKCHSQI